MPFNPENAAHRSTLRAHWQAGTYDSVRDFLPECNDPEKNKAANTRTKSTGELLIEDLIIVLDNSEYSKFSDFEKAWIQSLFARDPKAPAQPFMKIFRNIFPTGTVKDAFEGTTQRTSWAEDNFGTNAVIKSEHVYAAVPALTTPKTTDPKT